MEIGLKNLQQSLANYTRRIREYCIIDAGSTVLNVPIKDAYWINNQHQNFMLQVISGDDYNDWSVVQSNTANILTVNPVLDVVPAEGDILIIYDFINSAGGAVTTIDITEWGGTAQTGANLTPLFQNLDLATTDLRDALRGVGNITNTDINNSIQGTQPRDITQWGGIAQTGADLTPLFQNLSALTVGAGATTTICTTANISGGITSILGDYSRWTLFINTAGVINITIELSPDGGITYYDITESPIIFGAAADNVIEIGYDATNIRLTGSNAVLVTAQIRGVF